MKVAGLIVALFLTLLGAGTALAVDPTPTPIPLPADQIFGQLATANAGISTLGGSLNAPNGSPLIPPVDGREAWGYVKWMISPVGAGELFGPFAIIFSELGFFLTSTLALTAVYLVVYAASYIFRLVLGLYRLIGENIVLTVVVITIIAILAAIVAFQNVVINIANSLRDGANAELTTAYQIGYIILYYLNGGT